jgi:hypothetical protein
MKRANWRTSSPDADLIKRFLERALRSADHIQSNLR